MKVLAVLWMVSLVGLCHGKGGNKRYHYGENGPCNNSKKAQSTPQPTVAPPSGQTANSDQKAKDTLESSPNQTASLPKTPTVKQGVQAKSGDAPVKTVPQGQTPQSPTRPNTQAAPQGLQAQQRGVQVKPANKPGDVPVRRDPVKTVQPTPQAPSTGKPATDESPVVQQNTSTSTQSPQGGQATAKSAQPDQKTTETAKKGQGVKVKPVESPVPTPKEEVSPQDNGTSKPATDESPVPQSTRPSGPVLDLANPDESKVNMSTNTHRGLTIEDYTPKDAVLITSVVDGPTSIWAASGNEKFVSAKYAHRGGCSQGLEIKIKDGNDTKTKKFEENADGEWTSIDKKEFDRKLNNLKTV